MPAYARPSDDTDGILVVWQPSSNRICEFWRLAKTDEGWKAAWGGAMQDASSNQGAYGPEAWPGARAWWGSLASSLSAAGGLITLADLHLPPLTLMIAEAAQRYGIYVRDRARVTHFFAQDPTPTGANPYLGAGGYFEGRTPGQLLAKFPWDRLRLLKMELHRRS